MDESEWPADFVLLTHAHGDHTHPETLTRLHQSSPLTEYLGPQEAIDLIVAETPISLSQCTTVNAADSKVLGTTKVHVVYSKSPAGDPNADIKPPDTTHLGFVIEAGRQRLFFSGDPVYTFAEHEALTAPIAALAPTVGFLTNHPTEGEFPSFDGCVRMAIRCRVSTVCPSHYGCFVARNYDPTVWAKRFPAHGPSTHIIPRNDYAVFGPQAT